jgi:hypothetical protein
LLDRIDVVQPLQLITYDRNTKVPDDQIALSSNTFTGDGEVGDFLQAVMDFAWSQGFRPKGLEDHRNELKAVRDHLADMRHLALPRHGEGPVTSNIDIDMREALRPR